MTDYSFLTGVWKSIKNVAIVLAPAAAAGWVTFQAEVPVDYQPYIVTATAFVVYLFKNYLQIRLE